VYFCELAPSLGRNRHRRYGRYTLEAREIGRDHSDDQLIENGFQQLGICSGRRNANIVHPLYQPVFLAEIIRLFFVAAIRIVRVAIVAITDHQSLKISWQTPAERIGVWAQQVID
jgi:hypothetical protein